MCGIAGVRRFGDTPITGEEIILLLCSIEHRGQHATGILLENPDGLHVLKAADPAWKFTKSKEFLEFLEAHLLPETTTALLHTRWATVGNPEINANNHPITDGETAIVHNGMISNYQSLFNQGRYHKSCETDSDIVRAIISEHGMAEKGLRELSKMAGSAAIAVVSTKYPGKLLLARSGSPLVYGFTADGNKLYWASETQAILRAAKPFRQVKGVWVQDTHVNVSVGSMPDDTAWLFGPETLELHHKFDICASYRQPDYSKGRESYHAKTRNWKKEMRRLENEENKLKNAPALPAYPRLANAIMKNAVVKCAACGTANRNVDGVPWDTLVCRKCDASIGE